MNPLRALGGWVVDRAGLLGGIKEIADHPVPAGTAVGKSAWLYIFGPAALAAFSLQVLTGVMLAAHYVPAPAFAYESLLLITNGSAFGRLLRGMHYWGASTMVVFTLLHMTRVFLTASYKYPREVNWMSGVILLGLTVGMAATGQLLRWDENGVWTVLVWSHFAARVPLIGEPLARLWLGGETVGGATLSRFFAVHVFIFPILIALLIAYHLYLVLHHGISEPPRSGRPVDRRTYRAWYQALIQRDGRPYWPDAAWKEVVVGAAVIIGIVALALIFGPRELAAEPDPATLTADPRPDWYLRWYYALLAVKPRGLEDLVMVYLPAIALVATLLLPILRRTGERSPRQRPFAVAAVVVTVTAFGWLTILGLRAPWVPAFDAAPLPVAVVGASDGPVAEGARLFHAKGCLACHAVAGRGGANGPELTAISDRLSRERLAIILLQGRGDMPGYGSNLTPAETEALLDFLQSRQTRAVSGAPGALASP